MTTLTWTDEEHAYPVYVDDIPDADIMASESTDGCPQSTSSHLHVSYHVHYLHHYVLQLPVTFISHGTLNDSIAGWYKQRFALFVLRPNMQLFLLQNKHILR